ncbi:response regulator transcription factor [Variovorax sp. J22R24]|nr:response regulator transcription factor [Variovorax sp. J22R24]
MKVMLVDDHALFRAGLRLLVSTVLRNVQVVEASTLAEAAELAKKPSGISLCLLDLVLKDGSGLDGLSLFRETAPDIAVVVVSATQDDDTIRACLDAGAMSFVPKSMPPEALTEALRRVLAGHVFLPDPFLAAAPSPGHRSGLSPRQSDVLRLLSRGLPTKSIARELGISENTVKEHLTALYQVLRVRNRTEAVVAAARLGLGPDDPDA